MWSTQLCSCVEELSWHIELYISTMVICLELLSSLRGLAQRIHLNMQIRVDLPWDKLDASVRVVELVKPFSWCYFAVPIRDPYFVTSSTWRRKHRSSTLLHIPPPRWPTTVWPHRRCCNARTVHLSSADCRKWLTPTVGWLQKPWILICSFPTRL